MGKRSVALYLFQVSRKLLMQRWEQNEMSRNLKVFFTLAIVAAIAAGTYYLSRHSSLSAVASVSIITMTPGSFEPDNLTVKRGTKVIFKNLDTKPRWPASNLHPTHGLYPEFDPRQPVSPGGEWSFVFEKSGSWKFHDHLQPNLRGSIVVED